MRKKKKQRAHRREARRWPSAAGGSSQETPMCCKPPRACRINGGTPSHSPCQMVVPPPARGGRSRLAAVRRDKLRFLVQSLWRQSTLWVCTVPVHTQAAETFSRT